MITSTIRNHRHIRWAATAAAALLLLSSGAAAASIVNAAKSTTIHACENTKSGALSVIVKSGAKCGRGTKALSWNTQGPAGPKGRTGPVGPSATYFDEDQTEQPLGSETAITSLTLPAGSYSYMATVLISSTAPVNCFLAGAGEGSVIDNAYGGSGTTTLVLVGASTDPGTATITCGDGNGTGDVALVSFTATRTGSLTVPTKSVSRPQPRS
jgi:hypothetical protein